MSETDKEYIQKIENELTACKQIIASLQKTIEKLQSQSSAAEILLRDFDPGNVV